MKIQVEWSWMCKKIANIKIESKMGNLTSDAQDNSVIFSSNGSIKSLKQFSMLNVKHLVVSRIDTFQYLLIDNISINSSKFPVLAIKSNFVSTGHHCNTMKTID